MATEYVINGKTYKSIDEIPEKDRKNLEMIKNHNTVSSLYTKTTTKISVNGQVIDNIDDLSDDLRKLVEDSGILVDNNEDGIPDVFQNEDGELLSSSKSSRTSILNAASVPSAHPENKIAKPVRKIKTKKETMRRRRNISNMLIPVVVAVVVLTFVWFFAK